MSGVVQKKREARYAVIRANKDKTADEIADMLFVHQSTVVADAKVIGVRLCRNPRFSMPATSLVAIARLQAGERAVDVARAIGISRRVLRCGNRESTRRRVG